MVLNGKRNQDRTARRYMTGGVHVETVMVHDKPAIVPYEEIRTPVNLHIAC